MSALPEVSELQADPAGSVHQRMENDVMPPRKKRQKISLACEECRARKVRCDGLRPQCGACKRRHRGERSCIYLNDPSKPASSRRELKSLYDRLAFLEEKLGSQVVTHKSPLVDHRNVKRSQGSDVDIPVQTVAMDISSPQSNSHQDGSKILGQIRPTPGSEFLTSVGGQTEYAEDDEDGHTSDQDITTINAMGMGQLTPDSKVDTVGAFYGNPSAASLLCDIQDQCHSPARSRSLRQNATPGTAHHPRPSLTTLHATNDDDHHLPPRYVADELLHLYWERVQNIYPFLHWPTFSAAYDRLWLPDSEVKQMPQLTGVGLGSQQCSLPVFYCALNAMFALTSQFTEGTTLERKTKSMPFVQRSRHLMRLDFLDNADICMVQALLILGRYLQTTSLPSRCWNVVGVACRMAQGLGLHIDVDEETGGSLTCEMNRRVWHSCMCLDTVLGMLTGRSCSNSYMSTVQLPSVPDDEISANTAIESTQCARSTTNVTFFAEAIRLGQILNGILNQIYEPWRQHEANRTKIDDDDFSMQYIPDFIQLDRDMDKFEAGLPTAFQWSTDVSKLNGGSCLLQQRHVLRSRFLHIRTLLYRPLFVQRCRKIRMNEDTPSRNDPQDSISQPGLHEALAERCAIACTQNAQELIEHISNGSTSGTTGSPWYSCYYMYHAAMIVVLANLGSPGLPQISRESLHHSWQTCEAVFQRMAQHDPEFYGYFRGLDGISKCVKSRTSDISQVEVGNYTGEGNQDLVMDHITSSYLDPGLLFSLDGTFSGDSLSLNAGFEESPYDNRFWAPL